MKQIALAITLLFASSFPAISSPLALTGESESYFAFILRSAHIGEDQSLNDNTPGVTYGRRFATKSPSGEVFIEGGVFYNSYEEVSPVLIGGYSTRVAKLPQGEIRLGGFLGTGYYKELGKDLNAQYGLPYIEGFIPLAGLTASYRAGRHEIRLTTVPAGGDVDAIFNLSHAFAF